MTSNIAVSGGAVERAMTRTRTGRIAAGADERGAAAAGAAGGANTGAMRASVDGVQAGGVSAAGGSGVGLSDLLPSTATVELLANGLQFMQLSYTLLAQGAERMLEHVPDFDMELTSPWTIHWSSWLGWMSANPNPNPDPNPNPNPNPDPDPDPNPNPNQVGCRSSISTSRCSRCTTTTSSG